jgi:hypothetical protein
MIAAKTIPQITDRITATGLMKVPLRHLHITALGEQHNSLASPNP